ncbi:U3 small nucleolar RNA-associated protein 11 [Ascobolus immersus RN42]|uniref:U3 small nucleolar RNA-associated protein 11 n=1 Tax=Ascobolus immersus RN42 TaxID=1160509 RepID=A0A3N4I5B5_ASCIM|nr:U3 small nucleolar RNA-associated protein 11 [Ascobolus immersus RN42]
MSSMRNAVQRRNHKERAQPEERKKWGLLEKKKDYQLRSRDYNTKKQRIKALREKAETRNPDEFHYGMMSSRTQKGIKIADRGNEALSNAAVALLKTQDANYLRLKRAEERKKIEKLEEAVQFMGLAKPQKGEPRKHTVFTEDVDEAKKFDPAQFFGTHESLLDRSFNRPRLDQLENGEFMPDEVLDEGEHKRGGDGLRREKKKLAAYKELESRLNREQELKEVELRLALQREKMGKGRKNGNKWAKVRKR